MKTPSILPIAALSTAIIFSSCWYQGSKKLTDKKTSQYAIEMLQDGSTKRFEYKQQLIERLNEQGVMDFLFSDGWYTQEGYYSLQGLLINKIAKSENAVEILESDIRLSTESIYQLISLVNEQEAFNLLIDWKRDKERGNSETMLINKIKTKENAELLLNSGKIGTYEGTNILKGLINKESQSQ